MKGVIKSNPLTSATDYPCLKQSPLCVEHYVVLFTGPRTGTVVVASKDYKLGHTAPNWFEEQFDPFFGTVELSN